MTKEEREVMQMALSAMKEALDAIESWGSYASGYFQVKHDLEGDIEKTKTSITAIEKCLANDALEKKAENARQLGLEYEPEQEQQDVDWEKLYRLEVKKKEAIAAKYEQDIKPLTKIVPMAQPAEPVVGVFDYKEHAEGLQRDYDLLLAEYNDLKAQQAEPVACGYDETTGNCTNNPCCYTSPPPRHPLTDEEIEDLYFDKFSMGELKAFARAIEAAVWEKQK
jgi:hypothetical protein